MHDHADDPRRRSPPTWSAVRSRNARARPRREANARDEFFARFPSHRHDRSGTDRRDRVLRAPSSATAASCRCTATGCSARSRSPRTSTQETFLRAWRRRETLRGARLAPRVAVPDRDERLPRRARAAPAHAVAPTGEVAWLQPYPDELLEAIAAGDDEPDAVVVATETIELAFMVAIQHLPPRPRAVLILRDVLGWSAKETAALLETSVAVGQQRAPARARRRCKEHLPERRLEWARAGASAAERALLAALRRGQRARRRRRARRADARGRALLDAARARALGGPRRRSSAVWIEGGFGTEEFGRLPLRRDARPTGSPRSPTTCASPGDDDVPRDGARRAADRGRRDHRDRHVRLDSFACVRAAADARDVRGPDRRRRAGRRAGLRRVRVARRARHRRARGDRAARAPAGPAGASRRGDLLWLAGVPLRALHNPGARAGGAARGVVVRCRCEARSCSRARRGRRRGRGPARRPRASR